MNKILRYLSIFVGFLLVHSAAVARASQAEEIMRRVATNQDRAVDVRRKFVYSQQVRIRALHTNGKLAREEQTMYTVVPSKEGGQKQLISLKGRFAERGSLEPYTGESDAPAKGVGSEVDKALVRALRDGLLNDEHSKDGIAKDLFPLTSSEIVKYRFTLLDEEQYRGRKAVRVAFSPKLKDRCGEDCASWKGEALVDAAEYQPIYVWTKLAEHIPLAVRVVFGTNIQELGFSLSYRRVADNVWFPASYGGEFRVRAVFFYSRTLTLSLENTGFKRASVDSDFIVGDAPLPE